MPQISQRKLSQIATKPRNSRKVSPSIVPCYTVQEETSRLFCQLKTASPLSPSSHITLNGPDLPFHFCTLEYNQKLDGWKGCDQAYSQQPPDCSVGDIPGSTVGGCMVVYDSMLSLYTRLLHCAGELTQAILLALNPERG